MPDDASAGWRAEYAHQAVDPDAIEGAVPDDRDAERDASREQPTIDRFQEAISDP